MDWPAFLPKGELESNYEQHFRRFVFQNENDSSKSNFEFEVSSFEIIRQY